MDGHQLDPRDIAEDAVLRIDTDNLRRILNVYHNYPDRCYAVEQAKSSIAIAARRAIEQHPPLEQ